MLDHQLFYHLKNIQQETLVFFGDHDMLIPNKFLHPQQTKEIARNAVAQMKHANLIMYAEAGHFIQIERAAEVNADVIAFLNANTQ
jgi:pimeloyl-ACP methyl ester carboxylesterase